MQVLHVLFSFVTLSCASSIYLFPSPESLSSVTHDVTSNVISKHLGLELLEPSSNRHPAVQWTEESFVGGGLKNAFVVAVDEMDLPDILPASSSQALRLPSSDSVSDSSIKELLSCLNDRSRFSHSHIFEHPSTPGPEDISSFFQNVDGPAFAALHLPSLERTDLASLRSLLHEVASDSANFRVAVITYSSQSIHREKRQLSGSLASQLPFPTQAPPQLPIDSVSGCFTSAETCGNKTSSCSGRGQCVSVSKGGRTCFVCSCSATKTGTGNNVKTDIWVGEKCERKDVSGPFALLTGTAIVLITTIVGAVSLLASIGGQELPSTLLGGAVQAKRD